MRTKYDKIGKRKKRKKKKKPREVSKLIIKLEGEIYSFSYIVSMRERRKERKKRNKEERRKEKEKEKMLILYHCYDSNIYYHVFFILFFHSLYFDPYHYH